EVAAGAPSSSSRARASQSASSTSSGVRPFMIVAPSCRAPCLPAGRGRGGGLAAPVAPHDHAQAGLQPPPAGRSGRGPEQRGGAAGRGRRQGSGGVWCDWLGHGASSVANGDRSQVTRLPVADRGAWPDWPGTSSRVSGRTLHWNLKTSNVFLENLIGHGGGELVLPD